MKVLVNAMANKRGGSHHTATRLLSALEDADESRELDVTILHTWSDEDTPELARFHLVRLPLRWAPIRFLFEQTGIPILGLVGRFDLLLSLGNIGPIIPLRRSIVFVNIWIPATDARGDYSAYDRLRQALVRWAISASCRSATVVVPAQWMSTDRDLLRMIAGKEPRVLRLGWDIAEGPIGVSDAAHMAQHRWTVAGPYLLSIGDLYPHKNFDTLIRAYAAAREIEPNLSELVIAGRSYRDVYTRRLHALAREYGIDDRVRFIGRVARADLPALYGRAVGVICPALTEASPNAPIEAVHFARPVLASRIPAHEEVLPDAATFDPRSVDQVRGALVRLARGEVPLLRRPPGRGDWSDAGATLYRLVVDCEPYRDSALHGMS